MALNSLPNICEPDADATPYFFFAEHGNEGMDESLPNAPSTAREQHLAAAWNVKMFFATFLILDMMVAATYGHFVWEHFFGSPPSATATVDLGIVLDGIVALGFTIDSVLAIVLLTSLTCRSISSSTPWESYYPLVFMNWVSNTVSFAVLACQRFHDAHGDRGLLVGAVAYLVLRFIKVYRLKELKDQIAHAQSSSGEDQYEALFATWASKRTSLADRFTHCRLVLLGIALVLTGLYCVYTSLVHHRGTAPVEQDLTPIAMTVARNFTPAVSLDEVLDDAADGAAIGSVLGPEMAPEGAAWGFVYGMIQKNFR